MLRRAMAGAAVGLAGIAVLVPAAQAKEVVGATVCGASGCTARSHPPPMLIQSSQFFTPAPAPAPFYRVRVRIGFGGRPAGALTRLWLPRQGLLAYRGEGARLLFDRVDAPVAAAFRAVTRDARPYAPRPWGAAWGPGAA